MNAQMPPGSALGTPRSTPGGRGQTGSGSDAEGSLTTNPHLSHSCQIDPFSNRAPSPPRFLWGRRWPKAGMRGAFLLSRDQCICRVFRQFARGLAESPTYGVPIARSKPTIAKSVPLIPISDRCDPMSDRFDPMPDRFDPMSDHFDPMSDRFDPMSIRFDPSSDRFDPMSIRFDPISEPRIPSSEPPIPTYYLPVFWRSSLS